MCTMYFRKTHPWKSVHILYFWTAGGRPGAASSHAAGRGRLGTARGRLGDGWGLGWGTAKGRPLSAVSLLTPLPDQDSDITWPKKIVILLGLYAKTQRPSFLRSIFEILRLRGISDFRPKVMEGLSKMERQDWSGAFLQIILSDLGQYLAPKHCVLPAKIDVSELASRSHRQPAEVT